MAARMGTYVAVGAHTMKAKEPHIDWGWERVLKGSSS
jgi:hypothetical protein